MSKSAEEWQAEIEYERHKEIVALLERIAVAVESRSLAGRRVCMLGCEGGHEPLEVCPKDLLPTWAKPEEKP